MSRFEENRDAHVFEHEHATSRPLPVVEPTKMQRDAMERAATLAREMLSHSAVNVRGEDALELANLVLDFFGGSDVERAEDPEACPGCGCKPGDGVTAGCEHPDGCGFNRAQEPDEDRSASLDGHEIRWEDQR